MEGDISTEQVSELLSNMVAKLKVLKRKVLHARFQLFQWFVIENAYQSNFSTLLMECIDPRLIWQSSDSLGQTAGRVYEVCIDPDDLF